MFNKDGDCKMVDFQFTTTGSVFLDFGTTAYYSMSPETTEANVERMVEAYYSTFVAVCAAAGVTELPWTRDDFGAKARDDGHYVAFLWAGTSYELVEKYPNLRERYHWNLEQAVKRTPHLFS